MNFTFLNKSHTFSLRIDWNFSEYGKLWTYNLCYFDFLHQTSISQEEGITLIHNFIDQAALHKDALEPFPISLRGINWIKFLSLHHISDPIIDDSLFSQYHILLDNLEYHLLGNHLLENGFSLLFGAYYYQNESFYSAAKTILLSELEEQILSDGAHFELSPMYHQIMLFRVLDCINLVKNNPWKTHELLLPLEKKASLMLGWLTTITYKDGSIPLLNDSAKGIAPTSANLFEYARLLEISPLIQPLTKSGYRKIVTENYECVLDVGNIGPDYIPGHAHSDTFNFELHIMGKPFIVDTGISTYESNQLRQIERSTASHNTVMIDNKEQS
ncbi:MAG: alginate lyase family protein, partial [Sulfuricurvum sp.]|nr:alginate lyase family protein [Sulfuricurvum sp.]